MHSILRTASEPTKKKKKSGPHRVALSSAAKKKIPVENTQIGPSIDWGCVADMSEFLLDICYWVSIYLLGFAPVLQQESAGIFM